KVCKEQPRSPRGKQPEQASSTVYRREASTATNIGRYVNPSARTQTTVGSSPTTQSGMAKLANARLPLMLCPKKKYGCLGVQTVCTRNGYVLPRNAIHIITLDPNKIRGKKCEVSPVT